MFLARYAEKAGTSILDMIARCREAGLPEPEFRQSGGQFVQTLGRPHVVAAPEVIPEARLVQVLRFPSAHSAARSLCPTTPAVRKLNSLSLTAVRTKLAVFRE